jgi:hypothetical protein
MAGMLRLGIIFTVIGLIALVNGLLRGKGNLNISRRVTLIIGIVLLVVVLALLLIALL